MRVIAHILFAVLLLLQVQLTVYAQAPPMLHFTVDDGLPSNTVYETYRDFRGDMWVATDKGIARYNGIRFETYTTSNGLPDNEILFFKEDRQQRLWMATYNGTLGFIKHNTIHTTANTSYLKQPILTSYTTNITVEQDSSITISFFDKSRFINIKDDHCTPYNLAPSIDRSVIENIVCKTKIAGNKYLILTRSSSFVINTAGTIEKSSLIRFPTEIQLRHLSSQAHELLLDNENIYTTGKKLIRSIPEALKANSASISQVFFDNNNCFFATNHGVFAHDQRQFLPDEHISNISKDKKGNYWLSTRRNGIFVINNLEDKVYPRSYSGEISNSFYKNKLFYATNNNSLHRISSDTSRTIFYCGDNKSSSDMDNSEDASLITPDYKYIIFKENSITAIEDIRAQKPVVKTISRFFVPESGQKSLHLSGNKLFLKWPGGIASFDYANLMNKQDAIPMSVYNARDRIFATATAADTSLWFSTINKVYKISDRVPVVQPQFRYLAFKNFIFFQNYLIGYTHANKLMVCGKLNSSVITLDSFVKENCVWNKLYPINDRNVLISTNNLYRLLTLHPEGTGWKFSIRTIESPFIPQRVEDICADRHNCYFFKKGTITRIGLNSILAKQDPPTPFFRSLKTTDHTYHIDSVIKIPYSGSKDLTINLGATSFFAKKIAYRYSVSRNKHEFWRTITGDEINLVNPGFGRYTVKVMARSISSEFSKPVVFTLVIQKPWWARWGFIVICIASGIFLVYAAFRLRIKHAIRKNEKQHISQIKFLKAEYKALNALMNPHFIFNTLNNVQSLINKDEKLAANQYLRIFANLIRQNMHNISQEMIPLQHEIDLISNYLKLEKLRFKDRLNYTIRVDEGIDMEDIIIPPLLIQPLVENSIKHGILPRKANDNIINIEVFEKDETLIIEVKDNGIGITASEQKTNKLHLSYGLENIRKRIDHVSIIQNRKITFDLHEIKDESGNVKWTVAVVRIALIENPPLHPGARRKRTAPLN